MCGKLSRTLPVYSMTPNCVAKLFDLFGWRRGQYKFKVDAKLQKANSLALDANPANIILEGARTPMCRYSGKFSKVSAIELGADERLVTDERIRDVDEVFVQADEQVPYGAVAQVLALVRQAGIGKMGLVTDPLTRKPR